MEITLTELNAKAEIYIRTERSEYLFKVTNPARLSGILTGGILGQKRAAALLACSKKLMIGSRAVFYLDRKLGLARLTTSLITKLELAAASGNTTP